MIASAMADSRLGNPEQNTATATLTPTPTPTPTPVEVDMISSLPDCLLCHILSFLPTRTSVATGNLSRRWRHVWQELQVFDFMELYFYRSRRLVPFVNNVLARRRAPHIRKFRLFGDLTKHGKTALETWAHTAIGPHLEELQLEILHDFGCALVLPATIFSCSKLVTLSLVGGGISAVELTQRSSCHLPSLKSLELRYPSSLDIVHTLLSGCPALETLTLLFGTGWSRPKFGAPRIRVPSSLKSLRFTDNYCGIEELDIDTPSLEYLSIVATGVRLSVRNLHNVVEANIDLFQCDSLRNLLRELRTTRILIMSPSTVNCLLQAPLDLPEFNYLLQLKLTLPCFDARFVMNMLEKCRMLQVLTIDIDKREVAEDYSQA